MGVPQNGWFIVESPFINADWGVPTLPWYFHHQKRGPFPTKPGATRHSPWWVFLHGFVWTHAIHQIQGFLWTCSPSRMSGVWAIPHFQSNPNIRFLLTYSIYIYYIWYMIYSILYIIWYIIIYIYIYYMIYIYIMIYYILYDI